MHPFTKVSIVVSASLVALGMWRMSQEGRGAGTVVAQGRTMRVHDATFGSSQHSPRPYNPPLSRKVRDALRSGSLAPLTTTQTGPAVSGGARELVLWVSEEDAPDFSQRRAPVCDLEIHLPDGQILLGSSGGSGGNSSSGWLETLGSFQIVPWREKELEVRFTIADERHRQRYRNPAYKSDLPAWQPQALPLTWEGDGLSATLQALELVWNEHVTYKGLRWELRQKWSLTWNGRPAGDAYSVEAEVEDSGGNRSPYGGLLGEPAWKLNCAISRTYGFPFAKEEVRWFGLVDPNRSAALPAGECEMLEVDPESRSSGILFAGIFAPGEYEIEDGEVVAQSQRANAIVSGIPANSSRPRLIPSPDASSSP